MAESVRIGWPAVLPAATNSPPRTVQAGAQARIDALDGLRGVLAMMVVLAHYFGEVPNGVSAVLFGWIAVKVFFVLSGFLMARIILDHVGTPGFFTAFYMRRACRTIPVYLVALAIVLAASLAFGATPWMDADRILPFWSYATFTQGFVMMARGDYGTEWLTPTWTLTVEEQFYLAAPILCLLVPRRHLFRTIVALTLASVAFRALAHGCGLFAPMIANISLPGAAHSMLLGMIAAMLLRDADHDWTRWDGALRIAPIALLVLVLVMRAAEGEQSMWFQIVGVPLVSVAAAAYLVSIVRGAPEAQRLAGSAQGFLGRLSYGIYLLHMPVLGLMHGIILGGRPDIGTSAQLAVTCLAVPAAIALAWLVHRTIEAPMIAWGRTWTFAPRGAPPSCGISASAPSRG